MNLAFLTLGIFDYRMDDTGDTVGNVGGVKVPKVVLGGQAGDDEPWPILQTVSWEA